MLVHLHGGLVRQPVDRLKSLAGGPTASRFLAAGYRRADDVRREIEVVRAQTARAFGVNLFVPSRRPADPEELRPYLERTSSSV